MAPASVPADPQVTAPPKVGKAGLSPAGSVVEAWGQGFNVGALVLLILIVLCNYRKRVILHKLILLELFFALWHGTFIFFDDPVYGWYLSASAALLYTSYQLHNVVSWLKIKPFLPRWGGRVFIGTLLLVQPFWIVNMWANFRYFNNLGGDAFQKMRSYEALCRDPWWIFTTVKLVLVIKSNYEYTIVGLMRTSPRFGVMLFCMFLSVAFLLTDVIVTLKHLTGQSGINPHWRLALVFKCASDTIFLDDFKSVLDSIVESALKRINGFSYGSGRRKSSVHPIFGSATNGPVVTISANKKNGQENPAKSGRVTWNGSRLGPSHTSSADAKVPDETTQRLHIEAETTIVVSEQDQTTLDRKDSSSSTEYYGSQDDIVPLSEPPATHVPEYRWGEPLPNQNMIPLQRTRSNGKPFSQLKES